MSILQNNQGPEAPVNPNAPGGWTEVQGSGSKGYKVDVTPSNPFEQQKSPAPAPVPIAKKPSKQKFPLKYLIIAIVIIFIALIAVLTLHKPLPTAIVYTTSIRPNVYTISTCGALNAQGLYYLNSNISSDITSGACLYSNSSNVAIICDGKSITGSGPYSNKTPYTYAVYASGKDNITVSGCVLSDFSYGIAAVNSTRVNVIGNKVYNNTMAGIYFSNTSLSTVSENKISGTSSAQGALFLGYGSTGNKVSNNTVLSNANVGINIYSSGENLYNNLINSTPNSFVCHGLSGLINASSAIGNRCTVNIGCDFLSCTETNYPINISQISLGSVISSCGTISSPGNYHISKAINANEYSKAVGFINASAEVPCITINAPDVHLNCESNNITNVTSGYAIYASSQPGLIIDYCSIGSSKGGIMLNNISGAVLSNISISNTSTGIMLINSNSSKFSSIKSNGGNIGLYIKSSTLDTFSAFRFTRNGYGIYINNSIGDVYNNGVITNNSRIDLYATNDSTKSGYSLMSNTKCGLTDAEWTTCANVQKLQLKFYPINSCGTISYEGNYSLSQGILSSSTNCITIKSSNVKLSCGQYKISSSILGSGTGIYASSVKNVTIAGCGATGFKYGYYFNNVTNSSITNGSSSGDTFGVYMKASKGIKINNISESSVANSGLFMNSSKFNMITGSSFNSGSYGIYLYNSTSSVITGNNGTGDGTGIYINTNSTNNTIAYNKFSSSSNYDYACLGNSSGIASELGGINYGQNVYNCMWLSGISQNSAPIACNSFFSPSSYNIGTDGYYGIGALCNGVYSNSTTINCNYNTITATHGGAFAEFDNVKGGIIENCILRGFTTPIIIKNSSVKVLNDKVYVNSTNASDPMRYFGIGVYSSHGFVISNLTVISNAIGVLIENSASGTVSNVNSTARQIGYYVSNTTGTLFNHDVSRSPGIGLSMSNSTSNIFSGDSFNGTVTGALCVGTSESNSSNVDSGANYCSVNSGCSWLKGSNC
ncbi:MAG: NosD domain-containing protein [Candidatus Micrarchaeaceae archaeon]